VSRYVPVCHRVAVALAAGCCSPARSSSETGRTARSDSAAASDSATASVIRRPGRSRPTSRPASIPPPPRRRRWLRRPWLFPGFRRSTRPSSHKAATAFRGMAWSVSNPRRADRVRGTRPGRAPLERVASHLDSLPYWPPTCAKLVKVPDPGGARERSTRAHPLRRANLDKLDRPSAGAGAGWRRDSRKRWRGSNKESGAARDTLGKTSPRISAKIFRKAWAQSRRRPPAAAYAAASGHEQRRCRERR